MNSDLHEKLSALTDDETSHIETEQLLRKLRDSEAMRSTWSRYHLIGETMRSDSSSHFTSEFQQRVSAAIADEPTVVAPRIKRQSELVHNPWIRQLAGAGIAATVTAAAILTITDHPQQSPAPQTVAKAERIAPAVSPIFQQEIRPVSGSNYASKDPAEQLSPYLNDHMAHSVTEGIQGFIPYTRVISAETNR